MSHYIVTLDDDSTWIGEAYDDEGAAADACAFFCSLGHLASDEFQERVDCEVSNVDTGEKTTVRVYVDLDQTFTGVRKGKGS